MREGAPPAQGRKTILLVEDDADVREFAGFAIRHFGYDVLTAASGDEALLRCETHPAAIDVLVSDMIMPGMNGADLADRVRWVRPGIRVLLLSGYPDEVVAGRGLGPVAFLQKPFSADDLARKIREILDGQCARG